MRLPWLPYVIRHAKDDDERDEYLIRVGLRVGAVIGFLFGWWLRSRYFRGFRLG